MYMDTIIYPYRCSENSIAFGTCRKVIVCMHIHALESVWADFLRQEPDLYLLAIQNAAHLPPPDALYCVACTHHTSLFFLFDC